MLDMLKKELNISIVASIIYIVLGVIVVFNPLTALGVTGMVVSISAIIYGIIITIINIANLKEEGNLSFGILLVVMGIALFIYPNSLNILISLGIGIWFITSSVGRIKFAMRIKEVHDVNWLVILICAIITLIIGISFIFTPLSTAVGVTIFSGISMIVYGIFDISQIIFIKRNLNIIKNELEKRN